MKVKTFNFPTFEIWNETKEFEQKIGDYACVIEVVFAWGSKDVKSTFLAAIANNDVPTNIYVRKVASSSIDCYLSDEKTLKQWYEKVTAKLNEQWCDFIMKNYIDEIN